MKTRTLNFVAVLIGAFAFNFIFWKEDVALNFTLFSVFSMLVNYFNSPEIFSRRNVQITTLGNLIACFFLLYHHSLISVIAAITSWIVMVGFYQLDEFRTVHNAVLSSLLNFFKLPPFLLKIHFTSKRVSQQQFERRAKIALLPILGLLVFYLIFLEANPVFSGMNDQFWNDVQWFFATFLGRISPVRILFFLFGFMITSWFVYKAYYILLFTNEQEKSVQLFRTRKKHTVLPTVYADNKGMDLGLKNENRSGVLMMLMISVLLLFINIIDIIYVWFGYNFDATKDFSADVHKGVNLLIFSIFLSIFIMIYYFRRNQNFYAGNTRLKQMAYFWIAQNVILIVSVIFRNLHYIQFHGLTQKRIGVFVFLFVVFLGLISLIVKIKEKKSFFYLSKFNSWSLYAVLLLLACFNWDMMIFNHNISQRDSKTIDLTYLVDLSDEVILNLEKHQDEVFKGLDLAGHPLYSRSGKFIYSNRLALIKQELKESEQSIFSWNYRTVRMKNLEQPTTEQVRRID